MNFLVTGANGFIGRSLVKRLLSIETNQVYGVDLSPLKTSKSNFQPIVVDITTKNWTREIPAQVDSVIHLAQSKRYRDFPNGAEDMVRVNIESTFHLLEWSRKNKVQKFLFASTGNVYKKSREIRKETDECMPDSMYASTKLSAELLIYPYCSFFQTIIVRIFCVYGPGQKDMIIPTMIKRVQSGREIIIGRGVGLYFTPLYISDCVTMIKRLLKNQKNIACGEMFNLAGNEIVNLADVIKMIGNLIHQKPYVRITDDEPSYLMGSNEKICKVIKYHPRVCFSEGISKTI